MGKKNNVHIGLWQSPCMNVIDKSYAFIANRNKLYISPELTEIVCDKVEKKGDPRGCNHTPRVNCT